MNIKTKPKIAKFIIIELLKKKLKLIFAMIYQEIIPCLRLQPFIKNYLLFDTDYVPDSFSLKPYPTRVEQALNFFVKGYIKSENVLTGEITKIAQNALFGQQIERLNLHTISQPEFLMFMVVFQPGAMHRLLGYKSTEFTSVFCDAEEVLSTDLQYVNDRIGNSKSYLEMVDHVEYFLLNKLKTVKIEFHKIDNVAQLIDKNPSRFSLDWLANQSNLSPRQLERKFSERMGAGPKLYSRIGRFYNAFMYKESNPKVDWLTIAIDFGYTDYYHLAKDFKQFANVTPNIMMDQYAKRPEIGLGL